MLISYSSQSPYLPTIQGIVCAIHVGTEDKPEAAIFPWGIVLDLLCPSLHIQFEVHRCNEILQKVKELGFKAEPFKFVLAIKALGHISKSTWEKKICICRSGLVRGLYSESIYEGSLYEAFRG